MAGGALDEAPPLSRRSLPLSVVRAASWRKDVGSHVSLLGLEDEHEAFDRYRAIRKAERAYI